MDFNFSFNSAQVQLITDKNKDYLEWFRCLNIYLPKYNINTLDRVAAFLSECSFESVGFTVLQENLNYSSQGLLKTFSKYFNSLPLANAYARQPQKIANHVYANRLGNGTEASGDGWRFRGRGIIQITGRENYSHFSIDTFGDNRVVLNPDMLLTIENAVQSACWFWTKHNLNTYADKKDILSISHIVNGGNNGEQERLDLYKKAVAALQPAPAPKVAAPAVKAATSTKDTPKEE